jgi:hypothetical protein
LEAQRESALVEVHEPAADDEELDRLTESLRRELVDLDVESVRRPSSGDAPLGARGIEFAAIGSLIIEFARSSDVLSKVVRAVQTWLGGRHSRTIKIQIGDDSIDISGPSSEEQERLISAWIARHSAE